MRNSKRYFSIFLLILIASANMADAQTNVIVKAGANFSNVIFEDGTGDQRSAQLKPGINIGLGLDIPIIDKLYFQPELFYSRKGFKQENNWFAGSHNNFTVTVSYFELPLNILFKPALGEGKLLLGAGPYLGYGTGGKWRSEEPVVIGDIIHNDHGDVNFKNDIINAEWGEYLYGKPWDYGVNFIAGYELFDRFSAQFNVRLGLANLKPKTDGVKPGDTFKNIGFGVLLGYKL